MARFQRGSAKRPIVSNKEIVDAVAFIVTGGVTTDFAIAGAVNDYIGGVGTCPLGATILGFYIEASTQINDTILGRIDWFLAKRDNNTAIGNFPVPGSTGGALFRKSIFHESKGIGQGNSSAVIGGQTSRTREFIKIPKKFRRMGEQDQWTIRVGASVDYSVCLKIIYKWYM